MTTKNKGGRPRVEFNRKTFERLCALQCTLPEISDFMDLSDATIERRCLEVYGKGFAEISRLKKGAGHTSLRRAQWRMAQDNPTMAIWLGKQYLAQTDKVDMLHIHEAREMVHSTVEALKAAVAELVTDPELRQEIFTRTSTEFTRLVGRVDVVSKEVS